MESATEEKSTQSHREGHQQHPTGKYLFTLCLGALGIVYGDIGTSPLYAIRECFNGEHGVPMDTLNVYGVLSLLFWSVMIIISVKYMGIVLRADNNGEGGILALLALVQPRRRVMSTRVGKFGLAIGLFGASLLYGDGIITPAISVLSAIEGLEVATPLFSNYIIPITMMILVLLFSFQKNGTGRIGKVFGPLMLVWYTSLAIMGIVGILDKPDVLSAINPYYAVYFFLRNGWSAFVILGTVFLAVTGGEALYADMGHFGKRPIRLVWFFVALPALLLNYFGQGALVLTTPDALQHPFFHLVPRALLYPMVILSGFATVIASQAVLSGVFSLTRQAVMLGYLPRVKIIHTSSKEIGQIYIPSVNWTMLVATLGLVLMFRTSGNLAAAYGIAVSSTMVITTFLIFVAAQKLWNIPKILAFPIFVLFLVIDGAFFISNSLKISHGGWVPLVMGSIVFTMMTTWRKGRQILAARLRERLLPITEYLESIRDHVLHVPGTAVFMTGDSQWTPPALVHNVTHNKVLHEKNLLVTIHIRDFPYVRNAHRVRVERVSSDFYRINAVYGFMQIPNVMNVLELIQPKLDFRLDTDKMTFFLGRETLIATHRPGMPVWRERLFSLMSRNAQRATTYFGIPRDRVVELGLQIEL